MALFELSSKKYKNGRRPFVAALYELQPPECVVDDVGTKFNENGITFLEEYASKQLDSIKDMSVTVAFLDEERTLISNHGDTGVEDGLPVFENATTIGHFTRGYIDDVEIDGERKRCVIGKGLLDEMRYKPFVETLETELNNGKSVNGSIEIYRSEGNDGIVYKKGWLPEGRIPTEYVHSGWAMVLNPADVNSTLLELNSKKQNKEEKKIMFDEKEMREIIVSTITETNSKNDELTNKIQELNDAIEEKDGKIAELTKNADDKKDEDKNKDDKIQELNDKVAELESKLNDCKKSEQNSRLDKALEVFSEDEQKFAESEINSFREDPLSGNVEAIVGKIYSGIGQAAKESAQKIAEQNSANNDSELDIFSEINSVEDDNDDVSIF